MNWNKVLKWCQIPDVNSWLNLLKEIRIHPQFRKSIPDFISKVKELTSGIEDAFLTLLERNLVMHLQFQKWIPQFRGVKSWKMIGFKFHDNLTETGVMPGKSQNAVLQLYSIILLCAVSKLKPKQYKLLQKWHQSKKFL